MLGRVGAWVLVTRQVPSPPTTSSLCTRLLCRPGAAHLLLPRPPVPQGQFLSIHCVCAPSPSCFLGTQPCPWEVMLGLVPGMSRLAGGGRGTAQGGGTAKARVLSRAELAAWGLGVEEERRPWGGAGTSSERQPQKGVSQSDLYFRSTKGNHLGLQLAQGEVAVT